MGGLGLGLGFDWGVGMWLDGNGLKVRGRVVDGGSGFEWWCCGIVVVVWYVVWVVDIDIGIML